MRQIGTSQPPKSIASSAFPFSLTSGWEDLDARTNDSLTLFRSLQAESTKQLLSCTSIRGGPRQATTHYNWSIHPILVDFLRRAQRAKRGRGGLNPQVISSSDPFSGRSPSGLALWSAGS